MLFPIKIINLKDLKWATGETSMSLIFQLFSITSGSEFQFSPQKESHVQNFKIFLIAASEEILVWSNARKWPEIAGHIIK